VTWTGWRTKSVGCAHEILEGLFAKRLTEELNRETLVYFIIIIIIRYRYRYRYKFMLINETVTKYLGPFGAPAQI
jgi:hypothetical protein